MKPELINKQVVRQVKDIIISAENLKHSSNFEYDAECFAKYNELKQFLKHNFSESLINELANIIPDISYKAIQPKWWVWFIFRLRVVIKLKNQAKTDFINSAQSISKIYSAILSYLK